MPQFIAVLPDSVQRYLGFVGVVLVGEVFFLIVFGLLGRCLALINPGLRSSEITKGVLERLMLSLGIAHGIPTVIIAFGALKVATKLSLSAAESNEDRIKKHNDYFLVGNTLSIIFGILYAIIARSYGLIAVDALAN